MEKSLDTLLSYQRGAEERFRRYEDERWKRETEPEKKGRREDQEHDMRVMGMLASMLQLRPTQYRQRQDFEEESISYYLQLQSLQQVILSNLIYTRYLV